VSIAFSNVSVVNVPLGCRCGVLLTFLALFVYAFNAGKMFFAFVVGLFSIVACVGGTFSLSTGS
jgi:hypothetical protein